MLSLITVSHLGTRLTLAQLHSKSPQRGCGADTGAPRLEKNFERLIVYEDEWIQSVGTRNWNVAYEIGHYYSKTHPLQSKWNFSSRLVSLSVVYLWASGPGRAYFLRPRQPQGEKSRIWVTKRYLTAGTAWLPRMSTFARAQRSCLGCSCPRFELNDPVERRPPTGLRKHRLSSTSCLSGGLEASWKGARTDPHPFFCYPEPNLSHSGKVLHLIKELDGGECLFFLLLLYMSV